MPSWVEVDYDNEIIKGIPTPSYNDKTYRFKILTTWKDEPLNGYIEKDIEIKAYAMEWEFETRVAIITSQVTTAVAFSFVVIGSIFSGTPSTGLWSFLQQQQMIIVLLMIDSFTPSQILLYLEGVGFVFLNKIPKSVQKLTYIDSLLNIFDSDQQNEKYQRAGFISRSTFINLIPLFIFISLLLMFHMFFKYALKQLNKPKSKSK